MNTEQGMISNRTTRKPRKGPGRPAAGESLTPQEVAEAALQLILAKGEGALTMRRLGEVLGVKAMALYNHFPDKEAILDVVASLALSRLPAPPAKGPWKSRIKAICHGFRSMALEHPNLFRVAMTRPTPPSSALPQIEAALSAFADAGLPPAAQAVAYHTLRLYVRAYCLWEIEEASQGGDPAELARVAAVSYPRTAAAAHLIFIPDRNRQFEAGLDLIVRGLQTSK
jgi:TetR/AcrR family transcriptional regulator, tetracycline repressor protein